MRQSIDPSFHAHLNATCSQAGFSKLPGRYLPCVDVKKKKIRIKISPLVSSRWRLLHGRNSRKQSHQLRRARKDAETDARMGGGLALLSSPWGHKSWQPLGHWRWRGRRRLSDLPGGGWMRWKGEDHRRGVAFPPSGPHGQHLTGRPATKAERRLKYGRHRPPPPSPTPSACVCVTVSDRLWQIWSGELRHVRSRPPHSPFTSACVCVCMCETTWSIPP